MFNLAGCIYFGSWVDYLDFLVWLGGVQLDQVGKESDCARFFFNITWHFSDLYKWKKDGTSVLFSMWTLELLQQWCHYVLLIEGWLTTWKAFGQVALNEANPWSSSSLVLVVPGIRSCFWTSLPAWSEGRVKLLDWGVEHFKMEPNSVLELPGWTNNIFNVFSLTKNFKHVHTNFRYRHCFGNINNINHTVGRVPTRGGPKIITILFWSEMVYLHEIILLTVLLVACS